MREQLFGYTPPGLAAPGEYVTFVQAFKDPDGNAAFVIRDAKGNQHEVKVPANYAAELGAALAKAFP